MHFLFLYRNQNSGSEPRIDNLIPHLILCRTCHEQLNSTSAVIQVKRNLVKTNLQTPPAQTELISLTKGERRMIPLIQLFARMFHTHLNADGIHGAVTFVPIEPQRFKATIFNEIVQRSRTQLGRVYRHPDAVAELPYYSDLISPER